MPRYLSGHGTLKWPRTQQGQRDFSYIIQSSLKHLPRALKALVSRSWFASPTDWCRLHWSRCRDIRFRNDRASTASNQAWRLRILTRLPINNHDVFTLRVSSRQSQCHVHCFGTDQENIFLPTTLIVKRISKLFISLPGVEKEANAEWRGKRWNQLSGVHWQFFG